MRGKQAHTRARVRAAGFSMAELMMVLVVVAFIAVAVTSGMKLKHSSELRYLLSEVHLINGAERLFQKKYYGRAGDITNPEDFFTGEANVAGNGDGRWNTALERDVLWSQLSQSGMISHAIDRNEVDENAPSIVGKDRPSSKIRGMGYSYMHEFTQEKPVSGTYFASDILRFGAANGDEHLGAGVLTIEDHVFIDSKIDIPNTPLGGAYIVGWGAGGADCAELQGTDYVYRRTDRELVRCTGNLAYDFGK